MKLTFSASTIPLVCDAGFFPNVLIGSYDQTYFWMSRSMYNDTTKTIVVGIDSKKINKFSITSAGVITFAAPSVETVGQTSISTMPVIGFTCIKAGVRVY